MNSENLEEKYGGDCLQRKKKQGSFSMEIISRENLGKVIV